MPHVPLGPSRPPHRCRQARLPIVIAAFGAAATTSAILGLPAVMPQLREAFQISYGQAGLIVSILLVPHAVCQALAGWAAGAVGVRRLFCWSLSGLGALVSASLLAPDYRTLIGLRLLTGMATGVSFVLSILYATAYGVETTRRRDQALVGAAAYLGTAVTYAAIPLVHGIAGWRAGYLPCLVFIGGALVLAWRVQPPGRSDASARPPGMGRGSGWALWTGRIAILAMAHLCSFGVFVVVASWLTSYFLRTSGMGSSATLYVSAGVLAAGALGRFAGGGRLGQVADRPLIATALACSGCGLLGLSVSPAFPVPPVLALLALGSCSVAYGSIVTLALAGRSPSEGARAVAGMLLLANLGGAALPTVMGWLVDRTGSFGPGFVLLAGLTWTAVCLLPLYPHERLVAQAVHAGGRRSIDVESAATR